MLMVPLTLRKPPMVGNLRCYRLNYRASYDEELVWALVQRHGGYVAVFPDYIDFWISPEWEIVLNLTFPDLQRVPARDYI